MATTYKKARYYKYYKLDDKGEYGDEFLSCLDIACEYCVTKNSVIGKFDRARYYHNSNIIEICGDKIERIEYKPEPKRKKFFYKVKREKHENLGL